MAADPIERRIMALRVPGLERLVAQLENEAARIELKKGKEAAAAHWKRAEQARLELARCAQALLPPQPELPQPAAPAKKKQARRK